MPPSASNISYLHHRNSFYSRSRQDSAGSNTSSGSIRGKRKASAGSLHASGTPAALHQSAILAASKELAQHEESRSVSSSSSASSSEGTGPSRVAPKSILLEDEYQEEVIQHMHTMELQTMASIELMDMQPELRWFMRPYLVDFLIELHQTFGLRAETLYLTLNIVDRYVSKRIVYKRHYQLVGCAALLIAAKFEDSKDRVPTVQELTQMCCNAYDESAFTQMESHVLYTIGWTLGQPTPEAWLRIAVAQTQQSARVQAIARFLMEVSLFHRDFVTIAPSAIASGALCLARYIDTQNTVDLEKGLTAEAATVARLLDAHLVEQLQDVSSILVNKYSSNTFSNAATIVRDYYLRPAASKDRSTESRAALLPAQMVGITGRVESEFDDDDSDRSRCTTPSSMASTPSRCGMDEDEDDEDDMPVTPLSLHSLHDPLVAAQSGHGSVGKENLMPTSSSTGSLGGKMSFASKVNEASKLSNIPRPPLRNVSRDCNMLA